MYLDQLMNNVYFRLICVCYYYVIVYSICKIMACYLEVLKHTGVFDLLSLYC